VGRYSGQLLCTVGRCNGGPLCTVGRFKARIFKWLAIAVRATLKGSMPFSVELDITGTDELAPQPVAWQAATDWRASA
jgi:hypothetical protein